MKPIRLIALVTFTLLGVTAVSRAQTKKLTLSEARKVALRVENGKIKSEELDKERGRQIYSFDIVRPDGLHEVNIDAMTGTLVEDRVESAKDEAAEAAAEARRARKAAQKATSTKPQ